MFLLTQRYLKEAKHYRQGAKKFLHYKRDTLTSADFANVEKCIVALELAIKNRSRAEVDAAIQSLDSLIGKIAPPAKDAGWRENVEVFLVAIVVAAGIKAFILQPFRIPTGSMQPTLFGIVATPTNSPPPNLLVRAFEFVWLGRHYIDMSAKEDVVIEGLNEKTYANFFTFTDVVCRNREGRQVTYRDFAPARQLAMDFGIRRGMVFEKGETMARGYVDTGDQVFVDKVSYNFTKPSAGDVFVFKTTGIRKIEDGLDPAMGSQHYIKRLAGMPGKTLRIDPPRLFIDGVVPEKFVFQRVMSMKDGYQGYSNGPQGGGSFTLLGNPEEAYTVPQHCYFALGDNSFHSRDSRDWGPVPERNVAGRGFFVYWPFSKRWGFIR